MSDDILKDIKTIGVLGAGQMGGGIAHVAAAAGYDVLLADVNDSDEDALRLHNLVGRMRCQINIIPFNPHPHAPFRRPSQRRVDRFLSLCRGYGLRAFVRTPRGDDIGAACGQLALETPGAS